MLRQIMIPSEENSTISIPVELYGREIEVILFPLETKQVKPEKKLPYYMSLNMSDFKFNRDEANAR
jgi:hypothetical protein